METARRRYSSKSGILATTPERLTLEVFGRINVNDRVYLALAALAAFPILVSAQNAPAASTNPIATSEKGFYMLVGGNVVAAAEKHELRGQERQDRD